MYWSEFSIIFSYTRRKTKKRTIAAELNTFDGLFAQIMKENRFMCAKINTSTIKFVRCLQFYVIIRRNKLVLCLHFVFMFLFVFGQPNYRVWWLNFREKMMNWLYFIYMCINYKFDCDFDDKQSYFGDTVDFLVFQLFEPLMDD